MSNVSDSKKVIDLKNKKEVSKVSAPCPHFCHGSEKAIRDGFGEGLLEVGSDERVVALTADLATSTMCGSFMNAYPERFFQVGICEQNMMSAAAGMAAVGKIPFINSFAAFSPGRNWDQLRVSVCYSNLKVIVHGSHGGITVGEDGATHQAMEDIAITRVLPNLTVIIPCDSNEAKNAVIALKDHSGPAYIRTSRAKAWQISNEDTPFVIGKAKIMCEGNDATIVSCGIMLHESLLAKDILENEGINVEIINSPTIKPLDEKTIINSIKKTNCCVTAEEHQIIGGLGGAVSEASVSHYPVPIERVGMKDSFGESGKADDLIIKYNLNANAIVEAVHKVIARKNGVNFDKSISEKLSTKNSIKK